MKHRSWRKSAYQSTSLVAVVLLILMIFVSVAYFFAIPEPGLSAEQAVLLAELRTNREAWEEKRPPSFRYVVERKCVCPADYSRPFVATEDLDAAPAGVSWIDDFFALTEAALLEAAQVTVSYDARFRFPSDIMIAYSGNPERTWEQIYVRDFEVIRYD